MKRECPVRSAFEEQAEACTALGSPFTARLCRLAAERLEPTNAVARELLAWLGDPSNKGDSVPLRLAASLHALVLAKKDERLASVYPPLSADDEALWAAIEAAMARHQAFLLDRLRSAPQTNEVRRSAALLPAFLTIATLTRKPLVFSEVGASAGLNLNWDRYRYLLNDGTWGSASPVELAPDWRGSSFPAAKATSRERAGCDLNPLDPASEDDRQRLLSYIWADQHDRLLRTRHALALAVDHPVEVERADAASWLERRLETTHQDAVHVVFHTIAWQYLPEDSKARGETIIAAAGQRASAAAPLARVSLEADGNGPGAALNVTLWPRGESRLVGRADFHGRWVDWYGWD